MAFVIPPYVDYPNEISPRPSREAQSPVEGRQYGPLEFDWEANGSCQNVDFGSRSTRPFSQIVMLDVDNTGSTIDAAFLFPDSQTTLVVPAGTGGRFPVSTSGIRFYAQALQVPLTSDITRVAVLNYQSMPVDIQRSEFLSVAVSAAISMTAPSTTQLVPATVDGTMVAAQAIGWGLGGGATGGTSITLEDGAGSVLAQTFIEAPAGIMVPTTIVLNLSNVSVRFNNGVQMIITPFVPPLAQGTSVVNLLYRD